MKKIFLLVLTLIAATAQAAYVPRNPNGAAVPASSTPVAMPMSVTVSTASYTSGTGVINMDMLSNTVSGWYDVSAYKSVAFTIYTGASTAGTISFEQTDDSTNDSSGTPWNVQDKTVLTQSLTTSQALAASTIYRRVAPVTSKYIRFRISTAISAGTAQATVILSQTPYTFPTQPVVQATAGSLNMTASLAAGSNIAGKVGIDQTTPGTTNAVTDTKLPAAAASADATSNPTVTQIGTEQMRFNGTSWDRVRNAWNTTTGDTGAKTTTFNGATQTNFNSLGAYIYVNVGTVSGTSPTMAVQLQGSFDGGTTWVNIGPAATNLTTSSTNDLFIVYPANASQAAGTTPVNLTTGATNTVAINAPLPRTWRLTYTIGGTTPSFTITNVQVAYIN